MGLFERYQKFMDAELQQRAVEYLVGGGEEQARTLNRAGTPGALTSAAAAVLESLLPLRCHACVPA